MATTPSSSYSPILPPTLAALIGEYIASWSGTSYLLTMLLAELTNGGSIDDDNYMVAIPFIGMGVQVQLGLLRTLGVARIGKENKVHLSSIIDKLERLKSQRDIYAHAVWSSNKKNQMISHTIKTVGKVRYTTRVVTRQSVLENIAALVTVTEMLVDLFKKHSYLSSLNGWNGKYF